VDYWLLSVREKTENGKEKENSDELVEYGMFWQNNLFGFYFFVFIQKKLYLFSLESIFWGAEKLKRYEAHY